MFEHWKFILSLCTTPKLIHVTDTRMSHALHDQRYTLTTPHEEAATFTGDLEVLQPEVATRKRKNLHRTNGTRFTIPSMATTLTIPSMATLATTKIYHPFLKKVERSAKSKSASTLR